MTERLQLHAVDSRRIGDDHRLLLRPMARTG